MWQRLELWNRVEVEDAEVGLNLSGVNLRKINICQRSPLIHFKVISKATGGCVDQVDNTLYSLPIHRENCIQNSNPVQEPNLIVYRVYRYYKVHFQSN